VYALRALIDKRNSACSHAKSPANVVDVILGHTPAVSRILLWLPVRKALDDHTRELRRCLRLAASLYQLWGKEYESLQTATLLPTTTTTGLLFSRALAGAYSILLIQAREALEYAHGSRRYRTFRSIA